MLNSSHRFSQSSLVEIDRLVHYIQHHAVDSEHTPIQPDETIEIVNQLIQQLVWRYPHLDQVLQELLDDLRFRG